MKVEDLKIGQKVFLHDGTGGTIVALFGEKIRCREGYLDFCYVTETGQYREAELHEIKQANWTAEQCRLELEEIAKEMNLPIEDNKVVHEWCKRGGRFDDEIFVKLIAPLYFPSPKFKVEWNEEMQWHTARKDENYKET